MHGMDPQSPRPAVLCKAKYKELLSRQPLDNQRLLCTSCLLADVLLLVTELPTAWSPRGKKGTKRDKETGSAIYYRGGAIIPSIGSQLQQYFPGLFFEIDSTQKLELSTACLLLANQHAPEPSTDALGTK